MTTELLWQSKIIFKQEHIDAVKVKDGPNTNVKLMILKLRWELNPDQPFSYSI